MKINVQSIHFDADRKLLDYIETKIANPTATSAAATAITKSANV